MILILLNWLFILLTTYVTGHAALRLGSKLFGYGGHRHFLMILVTGFSCVSAYAGYFSLFGRVSLASDVILVGICLFCILLDRKHYVGMPLLILAFLRDCRHSLKDPDKIRSGRGGIILLRILQLTGAILLFIAILYFTASGSFSAASGLYRPQAIRWIEECGTVKGLWLAGDAFCFDSSAFCAGALYGFSFAGQSLHGLNGYLAAVLTLYAYFCITNAFLKRTFGNLHTILAFTPIVYTVILAIELIAPDTDPVFSYLLLAILIRLSQLMDEKEEESAPYALLFILAVFLLTVKISACVLLLPALLAPVLMIRRKHFRALIHTLLSTLLLILPFLIRRVLISGRLFYPLASPDLFALPWKIPKDTIGAQIASIRAQARGISGSEQAMRAFNWVPVWWRNLSGTNRLFLLTAAAAFTVGLIWSLIALIRVILSRQTDRAVKLSAMLLLEAGAMASLTFWFLFAPDIRDGMICLLLVPFVTFAVLKNDDAVPSSLKTLIPGILSCMLLYPTGNILYQDMSYMLTDHGANYALYQRDYPAADVKEVRFEGRTFYYPAQSGAPLYHEPFPAVLSQDAVNRMTCIGDSLSDGFTIKTQEIGGQ